MTAARIELWEREGMIGNPESFNAVIAPDGTVDAQQVEWQIEHRYRFALEPGTSFAELARLVTTTLAPRGPTSTSQNVIVIVDANGIRREYDAAGEAHAALHRAIDPRPRKIAPLWSRGPYTGMVPFP